MDLVASIADQLDWHWRNQARPRLDGLTDEEYLGEPAPYAWTVRLKDAVTPEWVTMRAGTGEWLIDFAYPEPDPAPVTGSTSPAR